MVHESGKAGPDGLSFVHPAPRCPAIAAVVSYVVVYLLAGWVLGGRLRPR